MKFKKSIFDKNTGLIRTAFAEYDKSNKIYDPVLG